MSKRLGVAIVLSSLLLGCSPTEGTTANDNSVSEIGGKFVGGEFSGKPEEYIYSGISWGSDRNLVKTALAKQGYKLVRNDEDKDEVYEGKLVDEDATVFTAYTDKGRLVRLQIIVDVSENRFWPKYEIVKDALIKKYGDPYKDDMHFDEPYKEGDGYEAQAIKLGKATYSSEWWTDYYKSSDDSSKVEAHAGLTLAVKDKLLIYVTYISKNWGLEYDRRYKKGTNGL
ncbi:hypothetical protein DESA109040_15015 [Deinococcus saxicola]|uniref:hypothetical protein n=1 Tax=Deinococcus saxicola TaxID=249406 RepID=UPI0039F0C9E6